MYYIFVDYVPESCCVEGKSKHKCQGIDDSVNGFPVNGPPLHRLNNDRNDALNKIVSLYQYIYICDVLLCDTMFKTNYN